MAGKSSVVSTPSARGSVRYLAITVLHIRATLMRRLDQLWTLASVLLLAYALVFLWRTLYENEFVRPEVTIQQMQTYAALGVALAAAVEFQIGYEVQRRIVTGDIIIDLARPIDWQLGLLAQYFGMWIARFALVSIPAIVAATAAFNLQGPASLEAGLVFLPSVLLGTLVNFGIVFLIAQMAFLLTEIQGVQVVVLSTRQLLSGAFVPLWIFAPWVETVLGFAPFSSIHFAPIAIYVGFLEGADITLWLGRQLIWAVVLIGAGTLLSRRNLKRLAVQGG